MTMGLRLLAYGIAIAAVVDPQWVRPVQTPVRVGVRLAVSSPFAAAESLVQRIAARVSGRAVVRREMATTGGPWCADVDVCVVVADDTVPVDGRPGHAVHLVRLAVSGSTRVVAARAVHGHRAEMSEAIVAVAGGREGDVVDLVVEDDGVEVGRRTHQRSARPLDDDVVVPWWPRGEGARLISVRVDGVAESPPGTLLAETQTSPLDVLVWEGRPSWTGTFVRRALEADTRLVVRSISRLAPRRLARRGLSGPPSDDDLRRARAVVVSGAEALDAATAARLARYARGGGAVVAALDEIPRNAPIRALLSGGRDEARRALEPVPIGDALRAAELVSFTSGPGDAVLATWERSSTESRAVVVARRTGRGVVVASGALDAWRWRDDRFDRFWRQTVVRAARGSTPTLDATWEHDSSGPRLRLSSRPNSATAAWPSLTVTRSCAGRASAMPAVEGAVPGTWFADPLRVATACGVHASVGGSTVETTWPGAPSLPPAPPAPGTLAALATISGGMVIDATDAIEALEAVVVRTTAGPSIPERWHPMRAWWWFVPFTAVLVTEWWLRRRQGRR